MGFGDLVNEAKKFASSAKGKAFQKDAQDAYSTYNSTEGTNVEKLKAAAGEFTNDDSKTASDASKTELKTELKTEQKVEDKVESKA